MDQGRHAEGASPPHQLVHGEWHGCGAIPEGYHATSDVDSKRRAVRPDLADQRLEPGLIQGGSRAQHDPVRARIQSVLGPAERSHVAAYLDGDSAEPADASHQPDVVQAGLKRPVYVHHVQPAGPVGGEGLGLGHRIGQERGSSRLPSAGKANDAATLDVDRGVNIHELCYP